MRRWRVLALHAWVGWDEVREFSVLSSCAVSAGQASDQSIRTITSGFNRTVRQRPYAHLRRTQDLLR